MLYPDWILSIFWLEIRISNLIPIKCFDGCCFHWRIQLDSLGPDSFGYFVCLGLKIGIQPDLLQCFVFWCLQSLLLLCLQNIWPACWELSMQYWWLKQWRIETFSEHIQMRCGNLWLKLFQQPYKKGLSPKQDQGLLDMSIKLDNLMTYWIREG